MASQIKQELEARISRIRELIVEANGVYRQYLQKGDDATIKDYLNTKKAVSAFYNTYTETVYDPRRGADDNQISMYKDLKLHKSLFCRMAIKKMDRVLEKENGIVTQELINFEEPELDAVIDKLSKLYKGCDDSLQGLNIDLKLDALDIVSEYISSVKSLSKSELAKVQIPEVEEYMKEVRVRLNEEIRIIADEYKKCLRSYEEAYNQYREKGDAVTCEEFTKLQSAIGNTRIKGLNNSIKELAIEELKNEGSNLAANLDKYGWLVRATEKEECAKNYISFYGKEVEKGCKKIIGEDNRKCVLEELAKLIKTMKQQPISNIPNSEILPPEKFISVTLEKLKEKGVSSQKGE